MRTVTIVGAGRVGGALAIALSKFGYRVTTLVVRDTRIPAQVRELLPRDAAVIESTDFRAIESEVLFVTTRDSQIESVANWLGTLETTSRERFAFHASGALSSEILGPLQSVGWRTASVHPLISIAEPVDGSEELEGAFFGIEGEASDEAAELVKAIGGRPFTLDTETKPLYHAAAVVACGHLAALVEISQRMLGACGLAEDEAREVLFPLVLSTVRNLEGRDPAEVLTGPFARADVETIKGHLNKIERLADEDIEKVYRVLGGISTEMAERAGGDKDKLMDIRKMILLDKT